MIEWQPMGVEDLVAVMDIAACVHAEFPEDLEVFAERLRLYPQGCFVLKSEKTSLGYFITHPWFFGCPPPLNRLLGKLPESGSDYYFHDLALMPEVRRSGLGSIIVRRLVDQASALGFARITLVSVHGSAPFLERLGFESCENPSLAAKLASYGDQARYMVQRLRQL